MQHNATLTRKDRLAEAKCCVFSAFGFGPRRARGAISMPNVKSVENTPLIREKVVSKDFLTIRPSVTPFGHSL